ncbi:MAG TPA: hypothetical protein VIT65_23185 [Microlunatus sp.]
MHRSITTIDGRPVLHTTNGVDTRTSPLYLKELKPYRPDPNGFVTELADNIIDVVKSHPALHDQGSWRTALWAERGDEGYQDLQALLVVPAPKGEKACGTAMCIAGWAGELTGADWAVDADSIGKVGGHQESLITTQSWWDAKSPCDAYPASQLDFSAMNPLVRLSLVKRGFTEQHLHTSVSIYACGELGLLHGDWLGLFEGDNSIDDIEEIISLYHRYGVVPNDAAIAQRWPEDVKEFEKTEDESLVEYRGLDFHLTGCGRAAKQDELDLAGV